MDKLYVIKIGGNVIDDERELSSFLDSFASIEAKKILVHGGGKLATRMAEKMGLEQKLVEGRRVTDAETLKIVTMVYAGYINKNIVALLQSLNCDAAGFSGADGNLVSAHKRTGTSLDYGFAGDIDSVNAAFLNRLIGQGIVPVISPITHNGKGQLLNTNADTIAQEVAKALSGLYEVTLVYCFEKEGVMQDVNQPGSVIRSIGKDEYAALKTNGTISGGMMPKIDNAMQAIEKGVKKVVIGKAERLSQLVTGDAGTMIV